MENEFEIPEATEDGETEIPEVVEPTLRTGAGAESGSSWVPQGQEEVVPPARSWNVGDASSGWNPYGTPAPPAWPTPPPGWSPPPPPGASPWSPTASVPSPPSWPAWPPGGAEPTAGLWEPSSGQPSMGSPAGGGYLPPDPTGPTSDRSPKARRPFLVGLGAVVLVAAVAGGVLIGKSSNHTPSSATASETIPSPSQSGGPGTSAKIDVAAIAAKLDPAVVDITSIDASTGGEAAGTGMILTPNGEVLTNNHVIANATSITAQINGSGHTYTVRVLGTDKTQDVALVQLVGASGLRTVAVGNSSGLKVGDAVVAIGNALDLKGPETVTEGIVSALGRSISATDAGTGTTENLSGLIQTDAPINPGNSGGPLVNAKSQVVGIDTAALNGSSNQSATNIGFAIPINEAIGIAQQIQQGKSSSTVLINNKGFIGVEVISVSQAQSSSGGLFGSQLPTPGTSSGAYVAGVLQGTPAVQAGLQQGDVITAVNGRPVSGPTELGSLLSNDKPGATVSVTWITPSGSHQSASISLASRPVA